MTHILRSIAIGLLLAECAVLLSTGFAKLQSPAGFADAITKHELVSAAWTLEVAWLVIAAELLVPLATLLALTLRPGRRIAALLPGALWAAFAVYATGLVLFPPPTPAPCGCGLDSVAEADWVWIAARNFGVASVTSLCGLVLPTSQARPAERLPRETAAPVGAE